MKNPTRFPDGRRSIHIFKAQRLLVLKVDDREVFRARAALGGSPVGPKRREGDRKTPEGVYYVCTRNERSRFHLFLGISYPGIADAERGFREGLVTDSQKKAVERAIRSGECPPWNTPLGGAVGIHGDGSAADWTLGCVALDDRDVEILWVNCPLGTPIFIAP